MAKEAAERAATSRERRRTEVIEAGGPFRSTAALGRARRALALRRAFLDVELELADQLAVEVDTHLVRADRVARRIAPLVATKPDPGRDESARSLRSCGRAR